MKLTHLFIVCIGFLFVTTLSVFAAGRAPAHSTHLMGVMGDSIPSGTFADTSAGKVTFPVYHGLKGFFREMDALFFHSFIYGPNGLHWETPVFIRNKLTFSWASGEFVDSHYTRLRTIIEKQTQKKESLDVFNSAIPGEKASSLPTQAGNLIKEFKKVGYASIPYVTIMIGANDVCDTKTAVTSNEEFATHLRTTFAMLASQKQDQPIRVLLPGMPNIPLVGQKHIKSMHSISGLKCSIVRDKLLKLCGRMTHWKTQEEFDHLRNIVMEKNALLESLAQEASAHYPNLDVKYSNRFFETDIKPENLALDCFHPNLSGQQIVSDVLWQDQTWFQ